MDAHNKPKTVGEALRVKGRNPIESVRYKRKVTTAKKGGRKKKGTERGEERQGREKNIERRGPKGAEAPKGKDP